VRTRVQNSRGTSAEVWVGVLSQAQSSRPITREKLGSQESKHHSGITSKMLLSHQMHEQSVQQQISGEPRLHSQGEIITNLKTDSSCVGLLIP
jgi:hypothetical protein